MTDFVYDGSFDGFLCAAARALDGRDDRIVPFGGHGADLYSEVVHVPTEDDIAGRLRKRIVECAGEDELNTLLLVHASASADRHRHLLAYLRLSLSAGRSVAAEVTRPEVLAVRKARDRVSLEVAKLLGFVRFRRVCGSLYYAPLNPDADIVGLIGPHFAQRFPDQALLVHDVNRGVVFWSHCGASGIVDVTDLPADLGARLATDCEPGIERLWRAYFERITNPERRNPRLQRKLMPARYWGLLIERPGGVSRQEKKEGM